MVLTGNIVSGMKCGYGKLIIKDELIESIEFYGESKPDADWLLPGFIDTHFHGLGDGDASAEKVHLMAIAAPPTGMTTFCPALGSNTRERMCSFLSKVADLVENPIPGASRLAGSHLEGPYLDMAHKGGMMPEHVRMPDFDELAEFFTAARGTLKIMTVAPELPDGLRLVKELKAHRVAVSAGHTGMNTADLQKFVDCGGDAVCHLFNAHDGRDVVLGVPVTSVVDAAMIEDRLLLELIVDGVHVPPPLVKLTVRAAGCDRVVAITDSMQGAGLPDAEYLTPDGRPFILTNGDVCRLKGNPDYILGSCLTMNWAFYNLVERFGFRPEEAAMMTATNGAKYLQIADRTGKIEPGLLADIAVLKADKVTVKQTILAGQVIYGL